MSEPFDTLIRWEHAIERALGFHPPPDPGTASGAASPRAAAVAGSTGSPLRPEVIAGFPAFTQQFEGRISWMYQDVKGLVSTGVGNLIDPASLGASLPWLRDADGQPASAAEIQAEWSRVKALPKALVASAYKSPGGLHLSEQAIDELVRSKLLEFGQTLTKSFPDLASYPAPAQTALLSMAWAMGPHFPATWPKFSASVRARDWRAASASSTINTAGNPGVVPRNKANADLFLQAASADPALAGVFGSDFDPVTWIEIDAPGGYKVKTNAEPLAKNGVPVAMSFAQMIQAAKDLNAIPLTAPISDARWAAASVRTNVPPVASKDGAHFNDASQNAAFAASYGPLGTVLRDGGHKEMVLTRNLVPTGPNSMVFYGWRKSDGSVIQKGIRSDHDRNWIEYDSFASLVRRDASKNGVAVDLLAELQNEGPLAAPASGGLPPLPSFIVTELGGTGGALASIPRLVGLG